MRWLLRPLGYLVFVVGLFGLSAAARLLGDEHELGYFSGRLAQAVWRYPEVTRRGIQVAWLVWALLFAVSLTPLDPLATRWDEVALAAAALVVLGRRAFVARRAGR